MRNKTTLIFGILVVLLFLAYMVTYQVGFNEAAVVTTFGKAGEGSVIVGDDPESGRGAGLLGLGNLHFKWPAPIQKVYTYDQRVQVLEDRIEEQQTLDNQSVNVNMYVTWRISDPLAFHGSQVTRERAAQSLQSLLRDARSTIGAYTLGELTNADPARLKLSNLESDILRNISAKLERFAAEGAGWGIAVDSVGIKRLVLPESVTQKVFARMRATRDAMAQEARSQGEAIASTIKAEARAQADIILAFADQRAEQIRSQGDAAAAQWASVFARNEELAILLRRLETMRQMRGPLVTYFLGASQFPEFSVPPTAESISRLAPRQASQAPAAGQAGAEGSTGTD